MSEPSEAQSCGGAHAGGPGGIACKEPKPEDPVPRHVCHTCAGMPKSTASLAFDHRHLTCRSMCSVLHS